MPPSRQRELWESSSLWQDEYWAAFPSKVKALVKAYIEDKIDSDTFSSALLSVLGL
jgi:REP element-mobilizing transposase RayT